MKRTWHWRLVLGLLACGCSNEPPEQTPAGGMASGGNAGSGAGASGGGGSSQGGNLSQGGGVAGGGQGSAGAGAGGSTAGGGGNGMAACDDASLTWKTARKTWYTSYPDPQSEECVAYNGCMWAGMFAACNDKKSEAWVQAHNIVAAFPGFEELKLHDLCLKSGDKTIVVTVYDTCADSDCNGCCTQNQADNDALIDLESYTNERWGVEDGRIQWADLGPTTGSGCE